MGFKKLSAGFGIEVRGVDLSRPLPAPIFQELWNLFFENQVLVVKSQNLKAKEFLAFANCFGRPEPHVIDQFHHPEHADILILSNVVKDGKPVGFADAGTYFHTDYSYLEVPARATMLYSILVPKKGGDTLFANQYAAYDDLPPGMKKNIDPLVALHHYGNRDDLDQGSRTVASVLSEEQEKKVAWVRHRVARPHPVTGRTALYSISGSSFGIEGMPRNEAVALLGDLVIWDNASLLHSATLTDMEDPRTLWRITVKEERKP